MTARASAIRDTRRRFLEVQTMPPTLTTRKPVDELTASDLEAFPVWQFVMDEPEVRRSRAARNP